mgnify:CR=1 FL=1
MRILILIMSMLVFSSCNDYNFKLSELKHETLKYLDLPLAVKEFLKQPHSFDKENPSSLVLINSKETDRYILEVVNTWVGPWVAYEKLIDKEKNNFYRIEQGTPSPFFVYENKLYIPDRFNIIFVPKNIEEVEFTCYTLK